MSFATQTLRPPSRTLMFLEGRAIPSWVRFSAPCRCLSLAPKATGIRCWYCRACGHRHLDASAAQLPRQPRLCRQRLAQGRNLGLRQGVQHAMVDLVHELNETHGRKVSLIGWSLASLRAPARQDDAGSRALGDHARQPICGRPEGDQRLARLRNGERPPRRRRGFALRRIAGGNAPVPTTAIFSRTDGICAWQGCMEKTTATSESIEVESSHCGMGHHPGGRLCGRRSSGAAGRPMVAVRPQRLAQPGVSEPER